MAIIVNFDVMMATRKMSLNELSETVNITLANLQKQCFHKLLNLLV